MIKKNFIFLFFFFVLSCSNIEFVLKDTNQSNQLKNKTMLLISGETADKFSRELYSFFGNNKNYEYILKATFLEKKENRIVKKNQVAEKVEYTLEVNYDLFYKTSECKIFSDKIISRFSFTPKSAGYNFGADRSFDKLYRSSVKKNIQNFINNAAFNTTCF